MDTDLRGSNAAKEAPYITSLKGSGRNWPCQHLDFRHPPTAEKITFIVLSHQTVCGHLQRWPQQTLHSSCNNRLQSHLPARLAQPLHPGRLAGESAPTEDTKQAIPAFQGEGPSAITTCPRSPYPCQRWSWGPVTQSSDQLVSPHPGPLLSLRDPSPGPSLTTSGPAISPAGTLQRLPELCAMRAGELTNHIIIIFYLLLPCSPMKWTDWKTQSLYRCKPWAPRGGRADTRGTRKAEEVGFKLTPSGSQSPQFHSLSHEYKPHPEPSTLSHALYPQPGTRVPCHPLHRWVNLAVTWNTRTHHLHLLSALKK